MTWWIWWLIGVATGGVGVGVVVVVLVWLAGELNDMDRRLGMPHRQNRKGDDA